MKTYENNNNNVYLDILITSISLQINIKKSLPPECEYKVLGATLNLGNSFVLVSLLIKYLWYRMKMIPRNLLSHLPWQDPNHWKKNSLLKLKYPKCLKARVGFQKCVSSVYRTDLKVLIYEWLNQDLKLTLLIYSCKWKVLVILMSHHANSTWEINAY